MSCQEPLDISLEQLDRFVIEAKDTTYGNADLSQIPPTCAGAQVLTYEREPFSYVDRFVGGRSFCGQAIVSASETPLWAMNYLGFTLDRNVETLQLAEVIRASLRRIYHEERFLGEAMITQGRYVYQDTNQGDVSRFRGEERVYRAGTLVYQLWYHGGLVAELAPA
ncbi:MAG: DUF5680 domain-containing protein [Anaerolineae bacterium]